MLVILAHLFAIPARRNRRLHALPDNLLNHRVTVIAFVGNQVFGAKPIDPWASMRAILR